MGLRTNFPFFIARRYLVSKKSHAAINIISGVSVCGVAIATAALVCILSVFNGFEDMVADLFTAFDPELKIVPAEGKFMQADSKPLQQIRNDERIAVYTEALEDNALVVANNRQVMVKVKGVDDNFRELADIDNILYGDGMFELHVDVVDYGVAGLGVLQQLGLPVDFQDPLQVFAPCGGERIDMSNPQESFNTDELYSPKAAFTVKQTKYDAHYILTNIRFTRRLFDREGAVSSVELKLKRGNNPEDIKEDLQATLGDKYRVLDRYEQQESTFNIMKIEKLISYIFLTFIAMIACFNIIGSISMLVIDKKADAITLRNLGATDTQITDVFMIEGRLISLAGAVIGIAIGLVLCLLQQELELIRFGSHEGAYIINAYPVSVHAIDVIVIFVTVVLVGFISVWYPVRTITKKYTTNNQ